MRAARSLAPVVLSAADLAALVTCRPSWPALAAGLRHPTAWVQDVGADRALADAAGAAVWVTAAWLGLGLLAAVAAAVPGSVGRIADRVSAVLLPAVLRRVVVGVAGLGVLAAPVAAGAATPHAGRVPSPAPAPTASAGRALPDVPVPAWPTGPTSPDSPSAVPTGSPAPARPPLPTSPPTSLPAPTWPQTTSPTGAAGTPTGVPTPPGRTTTPRTPAEDPAPDTSAPERSAPGTPASPPGTPGSTPSPADRVTVRPDDSLWVIAARRLGPDASPRDIADEWPRWYAANRAVIGSDPDLVVAGQVLTAPERP